MRAKPTLRKFTAEELAFVSSFKSGELVAQPGTSLLLQGTNSAHLFTVLSGWAIRYKMLPDGRRQILNFALPSDFLGLQSAVANEMQHSVEALTDVVLCVFPRERLWELYSKYPMLAFDLTWLAAREEQILDENLLSVGRRSAVERVAYLLLHLFTRAEEVGLTRGEKLETPFTQQHVADTLGMSLVHTNKTLKKLSTSRAVRWKGKVLDIANREKLAEIGLYDAVPKQARPFI